MAEESAATVQCPFCESEISASARKCRFCTEWVARDCRVCGTPIRNEWAARGTCAQCEPVTLAARPEHPVTGTRNRGTAALFAFLLGGLGAHKFYLGRPGWGFLYLFFFWTFLPSLLGIFEGITYLTSSDEEFWRRYG